MPVVGDLADPDGVEIPLLEDALDLAFAALLTTSSMRSCDSESMISYGVMPVSRCGTCGRSISMPVPPRLPISQVEQVSPAAPMS